MSYPSSFLFDCIRVAQDRRATRHLLLLLNDHCLRDIGIERDGIAGYVRTAHPWPRAKPTAARTRALAPTLQGCG